MFWMTLLNRVAQDAPTELGLTGMEIALLDFLVKDHRKSPTSERRPPHCLDKTAKLGGYLARASIHRPATWSFGKDSRN